MNDDLYLDPANTSFEPEALKALVTAPRPSRERYPGLGFFAKHDSGDVGTEARRALDELDSNQAEIARLRSQLEGSVDEIRRVAEGWVEARTEVVRLTERLDWLVGELATAKFSWENGSNVLTVTVPVKLWRLILGDFGPVADVEITGTDPGKLARLVAVERANSDRLAELLGVQYETVGVLTTIEPDVRIALLAHRALRAVEGEPQHD